MKRIGIQIALLSFIILSASASLFAQGGPPPGGRPPGGRRGFDPDEMIKREKQNVYKVVKDLSDDQKMLLDGIYDEYSLSFKELREEAMQTRDFQTMRPKMQALQSEKHDLVKDVLNEEQFVLYQGLMEKQQRQRRDAMQRNRNQRNQQEQTPPAEESETEGTES